MLQNLDATRKAPLVVRSFAMHVPNGYEWQVRRCDPAAGKIHTFPFLLTVNCSRMLNAARLVHISAACDNVSEAQLMSTSNANLESAMHLPSRLSASLDPALVVYRGFLSLLAASHP